MIKKFNLGKGVGRKKRIDESYKIYLTKINNFIDYVDYINNFTDYIDQFND